MTPEPEPFAPPPPAPPKKKKAPPPLDEFLPPLEIADQAPPASAPGDYRHAIPIWISPRYLQWIVPAALLVTFVLTFFTWEAFSPGGISIVSQNAWQAGFGSYSRDKDFKEDSADPLKEGPGSNVLLIFYLILLCIALLLAIAGTVLNFIKPRDLPPGLAPLHNWRWLIVGAVVLVAFFFLTIQLLAGFTLKSKVLEPFDKGVADARKAKAPAAQIKKREAERGGVADSFHRTFWLRLAFWLTVLAGVSGLLHLWTTRRGNKPLPKLEFAW
jgi:hypothetical protein